MKAIFKICLVLALCYNHVQPCSENKFAGPPKEDVYRKLLDHHNKIRSNVATGSVSGSDGKLPEASNMNILIWHDGLAQIAQGWADKLVDDCGSMSHNPNRESDDFSYVGENLYWRATSAAAPEDADVMETASISWYNEVENFYKNTVDSFSSQGGSGVIGHFTQQIWADTTHIGCGYAVYSDTYPNSYYVVCNYGVGGNIRNQPIYQQGTKCSECKENSVCSTVYEGLCVDSNSQQVTDNNGDTVDVDENVNNSTGLNITLSNQNNTSPGKFIKYSLLMSIISIIMNII